MSLLEHEIHKQARGPSPFVIHSNSCQVPHPGNTSMTPITILFLITAQSPDDVQGWIAQLRDKSPANRATAGREIAQLGPKNPKAIPVLIASLDDENELVRQSVTGALTRIGMPAVPALTTALTSSKRWTRRQATLALAHIGKDA